MEISRRSLAPALKSLGSTRCYHVRKSKGDFLHHVAPKHEEERPVAIVLGWLLSKHVSPRQKKQKL
jgi:hypothetical protein